MVALCALCLTATPAPAYKLLSTKGSGAGQTLDPNGLAVDRETGDLFVADTGNNRVDVFGSDGSFKEAFGWEVDASNPEPKLQRCDASTGCQKGSVGNEPGQFNGLTQIDIDNDPLSSSQHSVYVADQDNFRIQKFVPESGEYKFGLSIGTGTNGTAEGQFSSTLESPIFVRVGPGGVVYAADSLPGGLEGKLKFRLQKFEPTGVQISPQRILLEGPLANVAASGLAVDSTGAFYLAVADGSVRKFNANGTAQIGNAISLPGRTLTALAVDAADGLLVGETGPGPSPQSVAQFEANAVLEATPVPERRFGYGAFKSSISDLAPYEVAGETVGIYASEDQFGSTSLNRVQLLDFPAPGPLPLPDACSANPIGSTKATLRARVNPEGKETTIQFEYLTQAQFEAGGYANPAKTISPPSASIGADFSPHPVSLTVTGLDPSTDYHCRVVAKNADAPAGNAGTDGAFETGPPIDFGPVWTTDVGVDGATLHAEVNPLGTPSEGHFQFVDDATFQSSGFSNAQRFPVDEIDFGAGEAFVTVTAELVGLEPGTLYHLRFFGQNAFTQESGPEATFRTASGPGEGLPDGRRFELVSPADKGSAEVAVPGVAGGFVDENNFLRIQAAAGSGEAVTYTSWTSFGNAQGAPGTSQYLSKRTAAGWSTENISPFGFQASPLQPPYRGFSADLSHAGLVVSEPALTPDCQEGFENLYLRDSATGSLRCITTQMPEVFDGEEFCAGYAGASADGSRVFFAANAKLTSNAPAVKGFSLYESSPSGLKLVSLLPGNVPATPTQTAGLLETGFGGGGGACSSASKISRHVISVDGSRAIWTFVPGGGAASRLLVRVNGAETVQADAKAGGVGQAGGGIFRAASADASRIFFTNASKLVPGASAGPDLYRYELPGKDLTDLTPGAEPSGVVGVLGASDDGSSVYFVATGALTGGEENRNGESAVAGQINLYLHREGEGLRFIAILGEDGSNWTTTPRDLTARVSADGRHLAFLSTRAKELAGYDNRVAEGNSCKLSSELKLVGGPLCPQAFVYDAISEELSCASCNPSGSRPLGPTALTAWTNPYEGPHYLAEDGSRLFFDSYDALLPDDENGKGDVYEFEVEGTGSCTASSDNFSPASGGCVFLVSSGHSVDHSFLLDASSDGRDAFFSTRERLTGWDVNDNYDVYDARVGGGFAEPSVSTPCAGLESCRPPGSAPPSPPASPATQSFVGPGNAKPAKPKSRKRGKKRGSKKKRSRKHHKKKSKKGTRSRNRRAGR